MQLQGIVVLAGGTTGLKPNLWTKRRLDKALEIFSGNEYLIIVSGGTVHKAPHLSEGFPVYESEIMGKYLIGRGVPKEMILADPISLDTIGNAYYCRTIHTDPAEVYNLLIITSAFHIDRAQEIFNHVFSLKPKKPYMLDFISVSNDGIKSEILKERKIREKNSLDNLSIKNINTLKKMHNWLYTNHKVYAMGLRPKKIGGKVLESY